MSLLIKKKKSLKAIEESGSLSMSCPFSLLEPAIKAVLSFTQFQFAVAGKQTEVTSITSALPEHIEVGGNQIRLLMIP